MKSIADSKRPQPDAYDNLWPLLPVFLVFLALVACFADTLPDHGPYSPCKASQTTPSTSPAPSAEPALQLVADPSVPSASTVMMAGSALDAKEIATF